MRLEKLENKRKRGKLGVMNLPREFVLIDRMIHLDEELHSKLEQSDTIMFAMKKPIVDQALKWVNGHINYSPLLCAHVGDIVKYRGISIVVV